MYRNGIFCHRSLETLQQVESAGDPVSASFCKRLGIRERQWTETETYIQHFWWRDTCAYTDLLLDQGTRWAYRSTCWEFHLLCGQIHDHHHSFLGDSGDYEFLQFGAHFRKSCKKSGQKKRWILSWIFLPKLSKIVWGFSNRYVKENAKWSIKTRNMPKRLTSNINNRKGQWISWFYWLFLFRYLCL